MNMPAKSSTYDYSIAPGVWGKRDLFVNYFIIQDSGQLRV
jgi:hypothetical protein